MKINNRSNEKKIKSLQQPPVFVPSLPSYLF